MCSNLKELNEEYGKTKEQYEVAQKQIAVEIIKISAGKEDWEKTWNGWMCSDNIKTDLFL